MMNCAKETENEKDHIALPGKSSLLEGSKPLPARRQTYSDGRGRAGLYNGMYLLLSSNIYITTPFNTNIFFLFYDP